MKIHMHQMILLPVSPHSQLGFPFAADLILNLVRVVGVKIQGAILFGIVLLAWEAGEVKSR